MDRQQRKQELWDVASWGNAPRLETLLTPDVNVNALYPNGKTLLVAAIAGRSQDAVEAVLRAGADPNQRDFHDRTPLMYAADKGLPLVAKCLLDAGAEVNARNRQGRTSLMYAAYNDAVEVVQVLLDAGAELNLADQKQRTALAYAGLKKGSRCQKLLKKHSAVNAPVKTATSTSAAAKSRGLRDMDEFTELKLAPRFPGAFILGGYLIQGLLIGLQVVFGPIGALGVLIVGWVVSRGFPSLWKIVPLWREIRARRAGWEPEPDATPAPRPVQTDAPQMEFVSQLMDLGARELATIHHIHAERRSLPQLESHLRSRVLSAALALSIVLPWLVLWWPGIARTSAEDILAGPGLFFVLTFLAYPPWVWAASRLEYKLRLARLRLVQQERDRIAGEVSTFLNAEDFETRQLPTDFGLYLRAFMTTDKLHIRGFDLETMLAYSIGPTLPLLALGQPGEHLGAGRVRTSDEGWQDEILRLMRAARLILIIPSHRAGTLWEIVTLYEGGFLEKTIFIMPPEMPFHGRTFSHDWARTMAAAQTVGVEFPLHIPAGAFFRVDADGRFVDFAPFLSEQFLKEFDPYIGGDRSGDYSSDASLDADTGDTPHAAATVDADSGLGADGIDGGDGFIDAGYDGHAGRDGDGGDMGGEAGGGGW